MGDFPPYVGYISCLIAGLFFGSNFVPVKKFPTGNGIFFQWILCSAIWTCGFVILIIRQFPPFQPFAMLGGFLWCTGNMLTVPIIHLIGLGLGVVLWGTANLLVGWSNGTFGILGVAHQDVPVLWLSYVGALFAAISAICFALIKPEVAETTKNILKNQPINGESIRGDWTEKLTNLQRRILGVVLSLIAGFFYGTNFNPPQYIMDNCNKECSQNGLDYVFSHFSGIYLTSTIYFLLYCVWVSNKPQVYPEVVLPGYISGIMWAIAQICWFIANSSLSLVVSFPIITVLPATVGNMWGILLFKEIKGKRNFIVFGIAYVFSILSIVCTVLANK